MKPNEKLLCKQVNELDLVDYLRGQGYEPQKIRGNDYWYLSPLRQENTASFKINRKINRWYDHGSGQGGTLVDFGIIYFSCSVKDLLAKFNGQSHPNLSLQAPVFSPIPENKNPIGTAGKIKIISSQLISNPDLIDYLKHRKIPLAIAAKYCSEVCFELYGKKQLAIGFKNELGGYELRSERFKGSSSPKEPRLIKNSDADNLAVFEGFFSFLSFQALLKSKYIKGLMLPKIQSDFLVLNSLAFFETQRSKMEKYNMVNLFLDRDRAGIAATQKALQWSEKYTDSSSCYENYKDINEYLVKLKQPAIKKSQGRGMRF